jgi:general stress protein 26
MSAARWLATSGPGCLVLALLSAACGRPPGGAPGGSPREPTRENVMAAAREIMQAARYCALVTVDADGAPRARTVAPLPPVPGEDPLVVWIATRPATRKVAEIRAEERVVLYYFDARREEYATLAGRARLVEQRSEIERRSAGLDRELYPDWPEDCLLIAVEPERLEVQGRGLEPDPVTWRPAGIDFP